MAAGAKEGETKEKMTRAAGLGGERYPEVGADPAAAYCVAATPACASFLDSAPGMAIWKKGGQGKKIGR